ncbi:uncharacterized protein LOC142327936 isoform X2 [Lycorma delicatula]|uniref:uncharacterized protein LOC142327936 isoform X2 n=1 Tax=Lycorma delicatula TaxID=130591 RepID=UPI003F510778
MDTTGNVIIHLQQECQKLKDSLFEKYVLTSKELVRAQIRDNDDVDDESKKKIPYNCRLQWSDSKHANSGVGLATSCLLFSWLELLLFDVRIFQYVRRTSGRYTCQDEMRQPLLKYVEDFRGRADSTSSTASGFYSPFDTPHDSDMEGENACSQVHALNAEDLALIKKGQEVI